MPGGLFTNSELAARWKTTEHELERLIQAGLLEFENHDGEKRFPLRIVLALERADGGPEFISYEEALQEMELSRTELKDLVAGGRLTEYRFGATRRYYMPEVRLVSSQKASTVLGDASVSTASARRKPAASPPVSRPPVQKPEAIPEVRRDVVLADGSPKSPPPVAEPETEPREQESAAKPEGPKPALLRGSLKRAGSTLTPRGYTVARRGQKADKEASDEKRYSERYVPENALVVFRKSGVLSSVVGSKEGKKPVPVRNISRWGICFPVTKRLEPGQRIVMKIRLRRRGPNVVVGGDVVRCEKGSAVYPYRIGVRFVQPKGEARRILSEIEKYIIDKDKLGTWRGKSKGKK